MYTFEKHLLKKSSMREIKKANSMGIPLAHLKHDRIFIRSSENVPD